MALFPEPRPKAPRTGDELFISTSQAAAALHVSTATVRNLIARGDLHAFRPVVGGKNLLLYAEEVARYGLLARSKGYYKVVDMEAIREELGV